MREMKDSGISWIGEIPINWEIGRIGGLYSLRNQKVSDKDYEPLSVTMKGVLPQLETAAKTNDGDNRKLVKKGDFAINSRSDRRGSCGIADRDGSVSLINTILKPRNLMNAKYYNWLFHTPMFADEFYKWGHGIVDDLWSTNWEEMKKIQIPFPSLAEQQRIAEFLDRECGKIDGLKADIQAQIDTLEQYKRSVITEAVTHGLNPSAPMKDSGINYISEHPIHWSLRRLKYILNERNERSVTGIEELLSVSLYKGVIPSTEMTNRTMQADSLIGYKRVHKGDLVFNKLNPGMARFGCSDYDGITSPDFAVYIVNENYCNAKFLQYLLKTDFYVEKIKSVSMGVGDGFTRLYSNQLYEFFVALPPRDEVSIIINYLDNKCAEIEQIIADKKTQIETLDGYKKSLIYEYVTGKKEVG